MQWVSSTKLAGENLGKVWMLEGRGGLLRREGSLLVGMQTAWWRASCSMLGRQVWGEQRETRAERDSDRASERYVQ